jgi:putative spermidine/putrescine transport system permease protein
VPPEMAARRQFDLVGGILVLPLVIFLALAFFYPLALTVFQSLEGGRHGSLTLLNYVQFLESRQGQGVLLLTLLLAVSSTVLALMLSLPLALLLRGELPGKSAIQFLMMIPAVIPALVGALGLLFLYDRTGWLNYLLVRGLHIIRHPLTIDYTIPGLILFYLWMFFPYAALVLLSGASALDPALEEAGLVLGASPREVFRWIVLPLLRPSLWAGGVLVFLQAFGAFSIPLIAGGNYQPLAVRIYTVATVFLEWHQASAMAVIMGLVQVALIVAYRRIQGSRTT